MSGLCARAIYLLCQLQRPRTIEMHAGGGDVDGNALDIDTFPPLPNCRHRIKQLVNDIRGAAISGRGKP